MILIGNCELKLSREALIAIVEQHLNLNNSSATRLRVTSIPGSYASEFSFAITTDSKPPANELNTVAATRPQPHIIIGGPDNNPF